MATFTILPLPHEVLHAPEMEEHSIEPGVELLRSWMRGWRGHHYKFAAYTLTAPSLEALPEHIALVRDEMHRFHFRRIGQNIGKFYDVTDEIRSEITPLLPD
jgi:hypothetical protein